MDVDLIPPHLHLDSLDESDQGQSSWPGSILDHSVYQFVLLWKIFYCYNLLEVFEAPPKPL